LKTEFKSSFARDLRRLHDATVSARIQQLIAVVKEANSLDEVPGVKKLQGQGDYYRIRLGDYRVGIVSSGQVVTFVRCLHRKDIYRYFP
jgi:mRNA interferase RelE/StbE